MSPVDPNTIYAGTSYSVVTTTGPSMIYKSTDGGNNWFNSSNGLPNNPSDINPVCTISISTADPNVLISGLFLNTASGGVYVSTDAGANWIKKFNGAPNQVGTLIRSSAIRPLFTDYFFIGLDRNGSHTNIGVWATTNGGDNWFSFNGGAMLDVYIIESLVFNNSGTHTLFAGSSSWVYTDGGIYEYTFSVVPVEMISFTGENENNKITLKWTTATELNNNGFEIERSLDNKIFVTRGFVKGAGTSTERHEYSFTEDALNGKIYYRLKQIDYDGNHSYTNSIEINSICASSFELYQNYPNPFNPTTKIKFTLPSPYQEEGLGVRSAMVMLKVYDILGREIATLVNEYKPAGEYEVEFNGNNLPSGIYFYQLKAGSYIETKKAILLK
jgi:hypothetical protein